MPQKNASNIRPVGQLMCECSYIGYAQSTSNVQRDTYTLSNSKVPAIQNEHWASKARSIGLRHLMCAKHISYHPRYTLSRSKIPTNKNECQRKSGEYIRCAQDTSNIRQDTLHVNQMFRKLFMDTPYTGVILVYPKYATKSSYIAKLASVKDH